MKKFLTLTLVMLLVLCGCGKKQENEQAAQTETSAQDNNSSQSGTDSGDAVIVTSDKELGEYASTFISKYVAGGKFYIKETSVSADKAQETVELAVDGKKTASRNGSTTQIVDGDTLYIVMHDQKAILTSPVANVMADNMIRSLGIKNETEAKNNLLSTGKETVNGTEYSFEEYRNGEETIKYYFDSRTLQYIKHIPSDGAEELYKIETISSNIPSDFFNIPENYTVQDLNSIAAQVG